MNLKQEVSSSHAAQGAVEKKKRRYQIISYETTAFYHYVDAESVEQVKAMIDNFWDEIPDAEYSDDVDSWQEISVVAEETATDAAIVEKVVAKLEAAKVVAAREWGQEDVSALEGYIQNIRKTFNGTTPPPDKAWAWLSGLEQVAESYR